MRQVMRKSAVSVAFLLAAAGCGDANRPVYPSYDQTILELAKANSNLSTFVALVATAELEAALDDTTGVYTVFAPTNAAFSALSGVDTTDKEVVNPVLQYHMFGGTLPFSLIGRGGEFKTVTATVVSFVPSPAMLPEGTDVRAPGNTTLVLRNSLGTANYVEGDVYGSNGVLHIIDAVMIPPTEPDEPDPPGLLLEEAEEAGFSAVVSAIMGVGLQAALDGAGPFTLFAPSDAALGAVDLSMADDAIVQNILLAHVVADDVDSSAVLAATSLDTLNNLSAAVDGAMMTVGGAALDADALDIEASNGRVHGLDDVIVPPTAAEFIASDASLSSLDTALTRAAVAAADPDTLGGDTPITLFAPTDAAFTAAGIDTSTVGTATLTAVLGHHLVTSGQVLAGDLTDGQTITTANGDLTVNVDGEGNVSLTDGAGGTANVLRSDLRTLSGVVHTIDAVLLPQ